MGFAIRTKLNLLVGVAIANGLLGFAAATNIHQGFVAYALGVWAACGIATLMIRCPRCGERAMRRKVRAFGTDWVYWGGFTMPKSCSNCGLSFRVPYSGEPRQNRGEDIAGG